MTEYPPHYNLHVRRELRRIGVDTDALGGIASRGLPEPGAFLGWLRRVPGGAGHAEFLRRLQAPPEDGGPRAPAPDEPEAPDAAAYADPEVDPLLAFAAEFDRVVPPAGVRGRSYGYDLPHGRGHALAVLRALPDGAGLDAFLAALAAAPGSGGRPRA